MFYNFIHQRLITDLFYPYNYIIKTLTKTFKYIISIYAICI